MSLCGHKRFFIPFLLTFLLSASQPCLTQAQSFFQSEPFNSQHSNTHPLNFFSNQQDSRGFVASIKIANWYSLANLNSIESQCSYAEANKYAQLYMGLLQSSNSTVFQSRLTFVLHLLSEQQITGSVSLLKQNTSYNNEGFKTASPGIALGHGFQLNKKSLVKYAIALNQRIEDLPGFTVHSLITCTHQFNKSLILELWAIKAPHALADFGGRLEYRSASKEVIAICVSSQPQCFALNYCRRLSDISFGLNSVLRIPLGFVQSIDVSKKW